MGAIQPIQYTAKELKTGRVVTGWYVQLHASEFDPTTGEGLGTYTLKHCLFNDMPAASESGGYWVEIDQATLRPVPQQTRIVFDADIKK